MDQCLERMPKQRSRNRGQGEGGSKSEEPMRIIEHKKENSHRNRLKTRRERVFCSNLQQYAAAARRREKKGSLSMRSKKRLMPGQMPGTRAHGMPERRRRLAR
jgi:hypothetical protein